MARFPQWDVVTPLAVGAALVLITVVPSFAAGWSAIDIVMGALMAIAGGVAARWPRIGGLTLALLLGALLFTPDSTAGLASIALLVPVVVLTSHGRWLWAAIFAAVYTAISVILSMDAENKPDVALVIITLHFWVFLFAVASILGLVIRYLRDRAERVREEQARRAAEDRRRIARDLHDTVVQATTSVAMRAENLRSSPGLDPDQQGEVLAIARSARQANRDLRTMLVLLRADDADPKAIPDPDNAGLERTVAEFVGRLRLEGFDAAAHVSGPASQVSTAATQSIGALLTEAGSNIIKHARPGGVVTCMVEVTDTSVELACLNARRLDEAPPEHEPLGLIGMQERVTEAGGTFEAHASGDNWVVRVDLPR